MSENKVRKDILKHFVNPSLLGSDKCLSELQLKKVI